MNLILFGIRTNFQYFIPLRRINFKFWDKIKLFIIFITLRRINLNFILKRYSNFQYLLRCFWLLSFIIPSPYKCNYIIIVDCECVDFVQRERQRGCERNFGPCDEYFTGSLLVHYFIMCVFFGVFIRWKK